MKLKLIRMETLSIKERSYNKPFIVFRIRSKDSYDSAKKICQYLIESNYVEYIFVEKLKELNSEIVFGNKEKDKYFREFNVENEDSNLCIIIGGDGTCLWANSLYTNKKRPHFLCFHSGNLGFLAIYDKEKYKETLDELYSCIKKQEPINFIKRQFVECDLYEKEENEKGVYDDFNGYKLIKTSKGLNEITVERKKNMLNLKIYLKDNFLTKIAADGIIVSTSTGSTAYNLSAGGPILHNNVQGIILNAICPFSLSLRPIVFPDGVRIRVRNNTDFANETQVKYDGIEFACLKNNQYVEMYLSDYYVKFLILKCFSESVDKYWIQKISDCLGWNYNFTH